MRLLVRPRKECKRARARKKRGGHPDKKKEGLWRLAPSVMRVVICVSHAFCSTDQERRESAHSVFLSLHADISTTVSFSLHVQGEKSRHFMTLLLVSPRNDAGGKRGEIPFWWHVMWIVLLIRWSKFFANQQLYPTTHLMWRHVRFVVSYMPSRNNNDKF